jgi:predicted HTH transcriptional regulator
MNNITRQTRRESYEKTLSEADTRRELVLKTFREYGDMTARECMALMGYSDGNFVKPRITELCADNLLKPIRKIKDSETNRSVAVFSARG